MSDSLIFKRFDGTRFAQWSGDLDLPYLHLPPMRQRCDGSGYEGAAYVMRQGKPWGVAFYQVPEITINETRRVPVFVSLEKMTKPITEAIEALRASWDAYVSSSLWC